MAASAFFDRVLETTTTTGTGTLTLAGAVTGYQTFAAVGDGNTTPMAVWEVDANGNPSGAWEVANTCTYTAAGTTLSRGTFLASSTGSAINFGAGTKRVAQSLPAAILNGLATASQTAIAGLLVTRNSTTAIDISAGFCYDPSSNKVISYAGTTALSGGTLGASQWNQVYLYDNAGTVTTEIVNNADPTSTTYAGTARQGGTNSNRRWIGGFKTNASSQIIAQDVRQTAANGVETVWLTDPAVSPFRVLSAGTATSFTAVSLAASVVRYAGTQFDGYCLYDVTTAPNLVLLELSVDGTNRFTVMTHYVNATSNFPGMSISCIPIEASTPQFYYKTGNVGTPKVYVDVSGYRFVR